MDKKVMAGALTTVAIMGMTATQSLAASQEAIVTADKLNVRSGPSTSYSIKTSLTRGIKVTVLSTYSNGWREVKLSNGTKGYCSGDYLQTKTTISTNTSNTTTSKKVVTVDKLNVRSGPSTSYSLKTSLKRGDTVEVKKTLTNGWSEVKLSNGITGYCSSEYLGTKTTISTNTNNTTTSKKVVTVDKLNVRSGPSTSYSLKTSLKRGDTVEVKKTLTNGWSEVKLSNGITGYCSSEYLGNNISSSNVSTNKNYTNVVQSYTTIYKTGNNRAKNVELAAKRINGTVIKPGEVFSYKKALGPITKTNGFYDAPVMSNGVANSVGPGGGVCQVSSTLYAAALKSGLTDIKSRNHSGRVSYMPAGVDAVISDGQDLRIRNTYKENIVIYASTSGGNLTVQIRSVNPLLGGKTYEIKTFSSTSGLTVDLKLIERNGSNSRPVYERTSYYVK